MPSIDEFAADDQPYSQANPTIEHMDEKLTQYKNEGHLSDDDFSEIDAVDQAEKNDQGQQKFFDMIKTCLLGNGL